MPSANIIYQTDAFNRRIGKSIIVALKNNELQYQLIYLNQLNPVAKLDKDGKLVQTYIYADKANTPSYLINQETENG